MTDAVIEGLKQFARVVLAATLPIIIAGLSKGSIDINGVIIAAVMATLMGVDKWVHENPNIKANGLSPF